MSGEVAGAHDPAVGRRVRLEFGREFAAVEGLAVGCGDLLERGRVVGKPEQLTGFRRPPGRHERLGEAGLVLEQRHLRRPLLRDRRRDQKAVAAIGDRGLEELLERKLAELGVQLGPRRHRPGHGHRIPAERGNSVAAEVLWRPCRGRAAGCVQSVQSPAVPDDGEGVRADAVGHRLHQVRVMAVAMAASTALPPSASIRRPAWAASGCDVHTTFARQHGLSRPGVGEAPTERCGHRRRERPSDPAGIYGVAFVRGSAFRPARLLRCSTRGVAAARQAVSSGAIQVSSAGSCELQNPGLCPPGEKPPAGGLGS